MHVQVLAHDVGLCITQKRLVHSLSESHFAIFLKLLDFLLSGYSKFELLNKRLF